MEGGLSRGLGIQAALGSVSVTGEHTGVKDLSRAGHRQTWAWLEVHAGSAETSESDAGVQIQDLCGRFWLSLLVTSSSFAERLKVIISRRDRALCGSGPDKPSLGLGSLLPKHSQTGWALHDQLGTAGLGAQAHHTAWSLAL